MQRFPSFLRRGQPCPALFAHSPTCTTALRITPFRTCYIAPKREESITDLLAFPRNFTVEQQLQHTRNFGIVAHIDAGKTTTTERMLFYAGMQQRIGEVDRGTTTTDFMPEEMERGISITAAAVSFMWNKHRVNLIDTPGHIDFSVEVQRSLRVVDGVVVVFDAKVGVQAQSYTVLHMARRNRAPTIAFMNKMDKSDANFEIAVRTLRDKLGVVPVLMQLPLRASTGECVGIIDLVHQSVVTFGGKHGELVERSPVKEEYLIEQLQKGRKDLVNFLAENDSELMEIFVNALDTTNGDERAAEAMVPPEAIYKATKTLLCQGALHGAESGSEHLRIMPVFLGASRRNIGVQTLMDAVIHLLPCPLERPHILGISSAKNPIAAPHATHDKTFAFAFKVVHFPDPKKGNELSPFVFFRVFSGKVGHKMRLYNRRTRLPVVMDRLYTLQADRLTPAPGFPAGCVGGAFVSDVLTGDTLAEENLATTIGMGSDSSLSSVGGDPTMTAAAAAAAASRKRQQQQQQYSNDIEDDANSNKKEEFFVSFEPLSVQPSVLSHAIEAQSSHVIEALRGALRRIETEDPSLRVTENQFGQLVVSGMGELHLDIVLSRLRREYSVNCDLTKAIVNYRESISGDVRVDNVAAVADGTTLFTADVVLVPSVAADAPGAEGACCMPDSVQLFFTHEAVEGFIASAMKKEDPSTAQEDSSNKSASQLSERKARDQLSAIRRACSDALKTALKMGPLAKIELDGFEIRILSITRSAPSWDARQLELAANVFLSMLFRRINSKENSLLLEPIMKLQVHLTDSKYASGIVSNLTTKHALSIEVDTPDERTTEVTALVPLRFITRYSKEARSLAKGNVYFWSELALMRRITDKQLEARILKGMVQ